MSDLARRTRTALVYGALVLAAVLLPESLFVVILIGVGVLAARELRWLTGDATWAFGVGLAYLAVGLGALALLRLAGPQWVLLAVLATWANDVASYLVGSRWGTARIAPAISPGKTVEGTVAGIVAALVVGYAVGVLIGAPPSAVFVVACFAGVAALAGDLLESALKRAASVKDSGDLLPGHGGVLDRIDSLLLVAPLVALTLLL